MTSANGSTVNPVANCWIAPLTTGCAFVGWFFCKTDPRHQQNAPELQHNETLHERGADARAQMPPVQPTR